MPKLDNFTLEIKTGEHAGPAVPTFAINGFPLEFDTLDGSAESGGTLTVTGAPSSFPHSLVLVGPQNGEATWDIESITATYECAQLDPYTVRMGAIVLNDDSNLNIWHEPPLPVFDV